MTPSFQGMEVPPVTVEHLAAFHQAHFGVAAPYNSFPASVNDPAHADWENRQVGGAQDHAHDAYEYEEDYYDDDGLGYYPDGEKRTLTDEQIAMFRHSEIARILRAREIALENAEAENDEDGTSEDEIQAHQSVAHPAGNSEAEDGELEESDELEEGARRATQEPGLRDGRRASYQSPHHPFERSEVSPAKRKLSSPGENEYGWPKKSRRAHVRYLDAVASDEQVLNYGDSEATSKTAVTAATSVPTAGVSGEAMHKKQGRKIWWPVLGNP